MTPDAGRRTPDASPSRQIGWHVVRLTLAAVLLAAAGLKGHQIITDPAARAGMYGPLWVTLLIIDVELLMAVWLLSNYSPRLAQRGALALVIVFAGVSLYRWLSGSASCGCFGTLPIHPGWTLALDGIFVVGLLRWRPARSTPGPVAACVGREWAFWRHEPSVALQAVAMAGSVYFAVLSFAAGSSAEVGLVADPVDHHFGVVPPSVLRHTFRLTNQSSRPIELLYSVKSCGCTDVILPAGPVEPGASVPIACDVDTRGRRGAFGARVTIVYKTANEATAKERALLCSLRATVEPVVDITPAELQFSPGEPALAVLRVSSDQPAVQAVHVETNHRAIAARVVDGGRGVEVAFDPSKWLDHEGSLVVQVHTSNETEKVIRIPVRVLMSQSENAVDSPGGG